MRVPLLDEIPATRRYIDAFKGYNHNRVIGEDEFFDMENMTSDEYPLLAPRRPRRKIMEFAYPGGLHAHEKLCWIERTSFYYDGKYVGEVEPGGHNMVSMGSYVIIWPDRMIYETKSDVRPFAALYRQAQFPVVVTKTSGQEESTNDQGQKVVKTVDYLLFTFEGTEAFQGIDHYTFREGDTLGITYTDVKFQTTVHGMEEGTLLQETAWMTLKDYQAVIDQKHAEETYKVTLLFTFNDKFWKAYEKNFDSDDPLYQRNNTLLIERRIPDMDYICELNNRLWGCSSATNELFCSALGDPYNWNVFRGDSQDSWAVNVGSPGPFTGICAYQDSVLFFKEDTIHRVYGTRPQNFQVLSTSCQGVEKGSARSVCILDDQVFYKSRLGICVYTGSLPTLISNEFGDVRYKNASAGVYRKKYYVNMQCTADETTGEGYNVQFVYDAARGLWHKEDEQYFSEFTTYDGKLFFICDNGSMYAIGGDAEGTPENCIPWMMQTGRLLAMTPDHKHISKVQVRVSLEAGSSVSVEARYDGWGPWIKCAQKVSPVKTGYTIPVIPRRCEFFELRLSGTGDMRLLGMAYSMEQGSEA